MNRKKPASAGRGIGRLAAKSSVSPTPGNPRTPPGLAERIVARPVQTLRPYPGNPRKHTDRQIANLMKCIERIWTNPILIDETATILAGHARLEAAKRLGMAEVPTLTIVGLTDEEKRAVVIADNRLPEQADWDFDLLREHFHDLINVDFEVELTGFSTGEVDLLIDGSQMNPDSDADDDVADLVAEGPAISKLGDIWELGRHRLGCGDALRRKSYEQLLTGDIAQMVVTDPPFNMKIGHAMGRGKVRHREFMMASGEMSAPDFESFLRDFIHHVIKFSCDGSIHYLFMDWRHLPQLLNVALPLYSEQKNLLVWNKSNGGQGSFYRSKHELITVFKNGTAAHINNFGLGAQGRYRTNVIDYPSVNSLDPARRGDLELHPTAKPVALIADLIRDCSRRNGIILDPFGGSGTTILAAERTGRVARLLELDPLYVDVAIRRWQRATGVAARHADTGQSFSEIEQRRNEAPRLQPTPARQKNTGGRRR